MYLNKAALINHCLRVFGVITVLAVLSIFFLDQNLTLLFKEDDWKWILAREITHIGLFTNYFIPAFIVWAAAWILLKWNKAKDRHRVQHIGTQALWLMYSLLFSGFWVHLFKAIIGRQRPKISPDFDPHVFQPFTTHWDFHSMPSGHTQVLFTFATFLAFQFPKYLKGFYFVAFIMAFTRVMTRDHFYSDVLMGVAVGHLPTVVLLYWLSQRNSPKI
jgi:membrane-associated phospholipid phosphatase